MARGKEKCQILRNIRLRVAEANNIPFQIYPCSHTGDCPGFCPLCDSEEAYLTRELEKKQAKGQHIRLLGIAIDLLPDADLSSNDKNSVTLDYYEDFGRSTNREKIADAPSDTTEILYGDMSVIDDGDDFGWN